MTELRAQALAEHLYAVYHQFLENQLEANLNVLTSACTLASILVGVEDYDTTSVWDDLTSVYMYQPDVTEFVPTLTRRWSQMGNQEHEDWFANVFNNHDWEDDV